MVRALILDPTQASGYLADVEPDQFGGLVGGWLETIRVGDTAIGFVNEEGKARGLPRNDDALRLLYAAGARFFPGDWIAGVMVVVGNGDDDGDVSDVPASVLDLCRRHQVPVG